MMMSTNQRKWLWPTLAACLACGSLPTALQAADGDSTYKVLGGPGLVTCAQVLANAGSGNVQEEQVKAWVAGFVSAYNRYEDPKGDVIGARDPQELIDWAIRYCRANPAATIATMSDSLIHALTVTKRSER